jgi:LacI family transcriptional regulator
MLWTKLLQKKERANDMVPNIKPTIRMVAEKANVSVTTVSRVINGNYPVSPEARASVEKAINDLGYRPNVVAQSLKSGKTKMIGVVIANIANKFFMELVQGVETVVGKEGYHLIICSTDNNPQKELELLRMLKERMVDGIIAASCNDDGSVFKQLIDTGTPVALVDRRVPNLKADFILEDNYSAVYKIVKYLIDNGHERIGILLGLEHLSMNQERFAGYRDALKENGIKLNKRYIIKGEFNTSKVHASFYNMLKNLSKDERPTALLACSGPMAEGVMRAVEDLGLSIPEDISLVSYGTLSSSLIKPKITAISQKNFDMGVEAGKLVLKRLKEQSLNKKHRKFTEIIINNEVIFGNSVKNIKKSID